LESKILYDLHTHTQYSTPKHAKGTIMENAKAAYEQGLTMLGITDHGPGHPAYGLDMSKLDDMRRDIDAARKEFPGMEILLGVEANIVNYSGNLDVSKEEQKLFDFIIAGYHFAYFGEQPLHGMITSASGWLDEKGIIKTTKGRIQKNTEVVIAALENNDIKFLTHPGDKMRIDIEAVSRVCERRGIMLELNRHHAHLNTEEIKIASKYNVKFILGSDAHSPDKVGKIDGALDMAIKADLDLSRIVNYRG